MTTATAKTKAEEEKDITTLSELREVLKADQEAGAARTDTRLTELEESFKKYAADKDAEKEAKKKAEDEAASDLVMPGYLSSSHDPIKHFSLLRAVRGHLDDWKGACAKFPERDVVMDANTKAQQGNVDLLGGFMIPPQVMLDRVIPALEARSVAIQAGAEVLDDLVGSPVEFPKVTSTPDAFWVEEGDMIGESGMEFGMVSMTPHQLGAIVPMTNRLLRQTSNRAERIVREHLARAMARKLDLAVFKGTSGDTQPTGILNQSGVQTIDVTGGSYANLLTATGTSQVVTNFLEDFIGLLEDADALEGKPTFFMHPAARRAFYKVKDGDGRPLLFESGSPGRSVVSNQGEASTFFGFPFWTSTQFATGAGAADLIFTDIERTIIGQWGGMLIDVSREAGSAYHRNLTLVRAIMEVDVAATHGEAVAEAVNLTLP